MRDVALHSVAPHAADAGPNLLRAWIDQGAKWPVNTAHGSASAGSTLGNQVLIFQRSAKHWAFQPVPKADRALLEHGPATIDKLVATKLKSAKLTGSPRADARTLLRRLHFDLTGLPPGVEEMEKFEAAFRADADKALAAKVDELLASPHFGERWGRYWLDLARYADTQDFFPQPDLRYPYAWTYRDYVVAAFNADKPYDRFIREQLAADQLGLKPDDPTLAALGYLTVGPRFLRRTDEIINDRIDVVTRGLMGMTVTCARCHDHKYDPIPTADYYSLHGVFYSTEDLTELPEIALAGTRVDPKTRAEYEAARGKARQAVADFFRKSKDDAAAEILAKSELYFDALGQSEVKKTADVRKLVSGKKMSEGPLTMLGRQYSTLRKQNKWWDDPVVGPLMRVAGASPDRRAGMLADMLRTGLVATSKVKIQPTVLAALRDEKPADELALVKMYGKLLAKARGSSDAGLKEVAHAFRSDGGWLDIEPKIVEDTQRNLAAPKREVTKLDAVVTELEATHPGAPPRAMTVRDKPKPVTPVIFIRGESARRGDSVPRRFLQVLDKKQTPFAADHSGRRELADRIASAENPLTPRVWANHVWRHLIGRPLVKTPGDFGLQADPPYDAELLDWLASALVERNWSTKKLVRDIVLSATWQQSSADRSEADSIDPDNNLCWRANRRRMDFEAMRDAMLTTSGQLDPTVGGRPINLSADSKDARRTIYGFVDRVNLDPLFTTFDFPSPDIASPERTETLVPQQALFALNDGFIIGQARALAKQAQTSGGKPGDVAQQIDRLYRRVYQRPPTKTETTLGRSFLLETASLRHETVPGSWRYGVGNADPAVARAKAFQPLTYFDAQAKRYQGDRVYPNPKFSFTSLSSTGGHPGNGLAMAAVRRWIAPSAGEYSIVGELSVVRQNKGDGVRARVIASQAGLLGEWIADKAAQKTELKRVKLEAGESVDFVVDCRDSTNSDGFQWAPTIHFLVRPEDVSSDERTTWDAQADFAPPPPAQLEPLEQLAHALLMTNEFLFVD